MYWSTIFPSTCAICSGVPKYAQKCCELHDSIEALCESASCAKIYLANFPRQERKMMIEEMKKAGINV